MAKRRSILRIRIICGKEKPSTDTSTKFKSLKRILKEFVSWHFFTLALFLYGAGFLFFCFGAIFDRIGLFFGDSTLFGFAIRKSKGIVNGDKSNIFKG
ncbi:hypothetical protein [Thermodesulfovibrio yellowstonii]|uniref:hypothetical protein n=1 Tax=Thermodesulfovibrio yellowstonii TaxID=28262 RepID=UPI0024B36680|nr:hypothetical protein [Thermodesulfovibrio yellowstonii]MDI6865795.1 hypothetical protein [Thermodesulfovibrio yellowstonii]